MKKFRKFISSPKVTLAVFGAAAVLLLFSSVGGARAALTYYSENHMTELETQTIDVTLIEKTGENEAVSNPEALLENLIPDGEKIKVGVKYAEKLSVQNTGEIDQYVRVTIYKYWVDGENKKQDVYPGYIDLNLLLENGWEEDTAASTQERTVIYYKKPLGSGESVDFADSLRIDPAVAEIVTKESDGVSYDYQGLEFRIKVDVDAVQTHNAADAILSSWGREVDNSGADEDGVLSSLNFK